MSSFVTSYLFTILSSLKNRSRGSGFFASVAFVLFPAFLLFECKPPFGLGLFLLPRAFQTFPLVLLTLQLKRLLRLGADPLGDLPSSQTLHPLWIAYIPDGLPIDRRTETQGAPISQEIGINLSVTWAGAVSFPAV